MQFAFGTGVFWGTPLSDANGNAITNPTPCAARRSARPELGYQL